MRIQLVQVVVATHNAPPEHGVAQLAAQPTLNFNGWMINPNGLKFAQIGLKPPKKNTHRSQHAMRAAEGNIHRKVEFEAWDHG